METSSSQLSFSQQVQYDEESQDNAGISAETTASHPKSSTQPVETAAAGKALGQTRLMAVSEIAKVANWHKGAQHEWSVFQVVQERGQSLEDAYASTNFPTEQLGSFIRLCLTDANFPAFVEAVEKELDALTKTS